jgi:hypothetical protein
MSLLSTLCFIAVFFACHTVFSTPVYDWSGKDSVKIDKWLVLEPVRLVNAEGKPIIDLAIDPSSGNRLLCYLFDDYEKELDYVRSSLKPDQAYSFKHWTDHKWFEAKTDSNGWFRADKPGRQKTDNTISFGVIDVSVKDTLVVGIRFSFARNGFLFLNRQLLYSGENEAGLFPGYMRAVKYAYLYPGLNRIALKVDDLDGAVGGKLLLFPPENREQAIMSIKQPFLEDESRLLNRKIKAYGALKPLTDAEIDQVSAPQDSLKRVVRFLLDARKEADLVWQLTRNSRYGRAYDVHLNTLIQAIPLIREKKDPFSNLRGCVIWAYWSPVTESVVPFHAFIPDLKDGKKRHPLMLGLHGSNGISFQFLNLLAIINPPPPSTFILSPTGRGNLRYKGAGEADILDLIGLFQKTFPIDSDRIILAGSSMGAMGSYYLIGTHGSLFSCAIPFSGAVREPATMLTLSNRPMWAFHGLKDYVLPYLWSEMAERILDSLGGQFKYSSVANAGHGTPNTIMSDSGLGQWALKNTRPSDPDTVRISGRGPRPVRMDWFRVDQGRDMFRQFRITAVVLSRKKVAVWERNVGRFTVFGKPKLKKVYVDGQTVKIRKKGKTVSLVRDANGKWAQDLDPSAPAAINYGGIFSISRAPLVFVYSTRTKDKAEQARAIAEKLSIVESGNFPVVADTQLSRATAGQKNLFFIASGLDDRLPFGNTIKSILQTQAPYIQKSMKGDPGQSIWALHRRHPFNADREAAVFYAGKILSEDALKRLRLNGLSDYDAYLFDPDLNVLDFWILRPDWSPAPGQTVLKGNFPDAAAVADTVLRALCGRFSVARGLALLEAYPGGAGGLSNKQLKRLFKDDLPVVVEVPGSLLIEIIQEKTYKRFGATLTVFTRGLKEAELNPDQKYRVLVPSSTLWVIKSGSVLRAWPVPVYDWLVSRN